MKFVEVLRRIANELRLDISSLSLSSLTLSLSLSLYLIWELASGCSRLFGV
jgi:hypothetical protein